MSSKKGAVVFEEGICEGSPHHADQTAERALALGAQTGEGLSEKQVGQVTVMTDGMLLYVAWFWGWDCIHCS